MTFGKKRFPNKATWEHIDNDGPATKKNIALCCFRCNSSKGEKVLSEWLTEETVRKHRLSPKRFALIVRSHEHYKNYVNKA